MDSIDQECCSFGNLSLYYYAIWINPNKTYVYTEALKGHRVLWKIEICYLIRMT